MNIFQSMHLYCQDIQDEAKRFNQQIQKHQLSLEELDKLHERVNQTVNNWQFIEQQEFEKQQKSKKERLFKHTSTNLFKLGAMVGTSKIFVITGTVVTFSATNPAIQIAGLTCAAVAALFDGVSSFCSFKMTLQDQEENRLNQVIGDVRAAKDFRDFLHDFNELVKSQNIDRAAVSLCLWKYSQLISPYQSQEGFSMLACQLAQKDPDLRQSLHDLEPLGTHDVSVGTDQPIPPQFLPTARKKSIASTSSESPWQAEGDGKIELDKEEEIDPQETKEEYEKKVNQFKKIISMQYRLPRDLTYIFTPGRWCIDMNNDVRRTPVLTREEISSPPLTPPSRSLAKEKKGLFEKKISLAPYDSIV